MLSPASLQKLEFLAIRKIFSGLTVVKMLCAISHIFCSDCSGKGHYIASRKRVFEIKLDLVQRISSDTMNPFRSQWLIWTQFIITFVDDATRDYVAVPVRCYSAAKRVVLFILQRIVNHFKICPRLFHSDSVKENLSSIVTSYFDFHRILNSTAVPHHLQSSFIL